ncbi:MAG TPA: lysophospholipid acyltransferase family protein [Terracidiphilus sp.]|nr:lysophospholipid acyltransferase family protein [Terracidiphilus sp.]
MTLRAARRAVTLCAALFLCIVRYWMVRIHGPLTLPQRALWLQTASRLVLASFGVRARVTGQPPRLGIVVSNHLSYLDILVLSSAMPCFFISKAEIDRWPYFGWAARTGGTLFLDRTSMSSAEKVAAAIAGRLPLPVPILFFPEGTSTDGSSVLPFYTRFFEPAVRAGAPVTAAAVRYIPGDGRAERDLCWFGDDPFLPHLWKTLGGGRFTAEVALGEPHVYTHRRLAATATRAEIVNLRAGGAAAQSS